MTACRDCFYRLTHFCKRPYADDDDRCDEYRNVHDEIAENAWVRQELRREKGI
jgi:hypothetical protein